jgi:hypothetical protein
MIPSWQSSRIWPPHFRSSSPSKARARIRRAITHVRNRTDSVLLKRAVELSSKILHTSSSRSRPSAQPRDDRDHLPSNVSYSTRRRGADIVCVMAQKFTAPNGPCSTIRDWRSLYNPPACPIRLGFTGQASRSFIDECCSQTGRKLWDKLHSCKDWQISTLSLTALLCVFLLVLSSCWGMRERQEAASERDGERGYVMHGCRVTRRRYPCPLPSCLRGQLPP